MALAIAPWKNRNWWDERARNNAGLSLEEAVRQSKLNHNGHDATDRVYIPIMPDILAASSPIPNGMTAAEWEAHKKDVAEFNAWYANKGIEQVVKNTHAGLFERVSGKVYDDAAHVLGYFGDIAGKAISLVPAPARKALVPASLIVPLLATACLGSGPEKAYADARVNGNETVSRYDSKRGILNLTIPVDYVSNVKEPVQGIVKVYNNGKIIATSEPYTLNPGIGTDFIVQASVPLVGNYTFDIVVETLGIQDSDPKNNIAQVAINATPTSVIPTATAEPTTYDIAIKTLNGQTAEHFKGVIRDGNSEQAISELASLHIEGRLALAPNIRDYTADKAISGEELSDLIDPDRDGIKSSQEAKNGTNPMDPSNSTQKISPATFAFVRDLAKYRGSINDARALPQIYSGLEGVIYVIERHPKIASGLNMFGNDALALLLADNSGIVDMDKYWFLTNATALQAQDFFYVANEIMWEGRFKNDIKGPVTDKKFDEKEREIANFRLRKQIEWQGKWSTPLEYERAVQEYGSEQRASNALRWRVLPQRLFIEDISADNTKGEYKGAHPLYSSFDSNAWLVVASSNNENSEKVRAEILARLNDPERYAKDIEDRIKRVWEQRKKTEIDAIAQKASEYLGIIFSEGKPYERAALVISSYPQLHHDNATSLSALWVTLVGASGGVGKARIIHPDGDYVFDSQFMFTLSKDTEAKLKDVFIYGIDDLRRLMPDFKESETGKYRSVDGLFGVYSNLDALMKNAKEIAANTPSMRVVYIPITK